MRAFIQCDRIDGLPINPNVYNAYYGLRNLGFECIFFKTYQELLDHHHTRGEVISGGLEIIRKRLSDFKHDAFDKRLRFYSSYRKRRIRQC